MSLGSKPCAAPARTLPPAQEAGLTDEIGIEVWRGGVNTWECDEMGHLNVRFYVARAVEGLVGLASAMGLPGAFQPSASATLLVKDQHIRFLREARARAALHMTAGILEIGESDCRILQCLFHSATGEMAASFQTIVTHATAKDERAFPWSDHTRALSDQLMVTAPDRTGPRSLTFGAPRFGASLAEADRLGMVRLGAGSIGAMDCDVFGRMRPELFIGRVSDGVPALAAARGRDKSLDADRPARVGGAVLEYRVTHLAWPRAGDRFALRSGLAGVDDRTQHLVHWMLDPETGRAWGTAEAVAVSLDLDARRIIPISESHQAHLRERIIPELNA